jgi:hypothetical protein
VAITDAYGWLAEQDLGRLDEVEHALGRGRRGSARLERAETCPACSALEASMERKAEIFVGVLSEPDVWGMYMRSDGLCFSHLEAVFG